MSVADNIEAIRRRMAAASERAGRDPNSIRLVGASASSKGVTNAQVEAAIEAGLHDLGENFVQEAVDRIESMAGDASRVTWHFIGHLQTNKVVPVLRHFDIVQSVDSLRLAEALSRRAEDDIRILLEVNVAGEASKHGFMTSEVDEAVTAINKLPHLELSGLMTMAPVTDNPETVRPVFQELRRLAEHHGLKELSMGMTDDFEVAIEEGATMIRLGRAIFGDAPS